MSFKRLKQIGIVIFWIYIIMVVIVLVYHNLVLKGIINSIFLLN